MADVYLYGMVSPSTVYLLRDDFSYPAANGYGEIARILPSIGGEAANSAIVLARLGLSTRLDGNWVQRDEFGRVIETLTGYGIDVSRLGWAAGGTREMVIADRESRTVFGNYAAFNNGPRQWNAPQSEDVADSKIACVDPYFGAESEMAAHLCVVLGKPYVTQDAPYEGYVAQNAAAISVTHELWNSAYPGRDPAELYERYLESCEGLVIFTFGAKDLWYGRRDGERRTFKPYEIEPVDTTGAGDSFRGAIAYGLLQGWPDERVIAFASAVAALVCLTMPHALNAPTLAEVEAFMRERAKSDQLTKP